MKILILDNYDSFTFNLYQYIGEVFQYRLREKKGFSDFEIIVKRNDQITFEEIQSENFDKIIISPGPGTPEDKAYFGVCSEVITRLGAQVPILGVCLGMQGIAYSFGGKIQLAKVPMHGKVSKIIHAQKDVFHDLPNYLEVMRYHSLIVEPDSLPDCFEITSIVLPAYNHKQVLTFEEQVKLVDISGSEIMAIQHIQYPIFGIQFHPESFATEGGKKILENFLKI